MLTPQRKCLIGWQFGEKSKGLFRPQFRAQSGEIGGLVRNGLGFDSFDEHQPAVVNEQDLLARSSLNMSFNLRACMAAPSILIGRRHVPDGTSRSSHGSRKRHQYPRG